MYTDAWKMRMNDPLKGESMTTTVKPANVRVCECGTTKEFALCEPCGGDGMTDFKYDRNGKIIDADECHSCQGRGGEWKCPKCQKG